MGAVDPAAEWVPISDLVPWDENPRHNDAAVKEVAGSIKRFGFAAPIIARREDAMVIAGHTRLKAAAELGISKVPVRWMDLDSADARMLALADNKLNERADWDDGTLAKVLEELNSEGVRLAGLGWDTAELDKLIAGVTEVFDDDGLDFDEDLQFSVVVRCTDERHQGELMKRLEAEGMECQPLIS